MAKSPLGLFAGRNLQIKKKQQRWAISTYKQRELGLNKKANPLGGAPPRGLAFLFKPNSLRLYLEIAHR